LEKSYAKSMVLYETNWYFIKPSILIGSLVIFNNYTAELVRAEKELSVWFPERSKFSYTDR